MLPSTGHDHVLDLLPGYALVALPEADLRRVETHLSRCGTCRRAFEQELEAAADGAAVEPPRASSRTRFLAHTGGLRIVGGEAGAGAAAVRMLPTSPTELGPVRQSNEKRRHASGGPPGGYGWRALAAALLVMALPTVGWFLGVKSQIDERDLIYALISNPAAAYPLTDSDVPTEVSGVLYANPHDHLAYIEASGLPPIPEDLRYQVWLMTPAEEMVSAGFLDVAPNGVGEALLLTPEPVGDYLVAVVTAEPERGSPSPTGPRTLGGWISG